jgi:hypothetical protein
MATPLVEWVGHFLPDILSTLLIGHGRAAYDN